MRRGRPQPSGQLHLFFRTPCLGNGADGTPMPPAARQVSLFETHPTFAPPSYRWSDWQREARKTMSELHNRLSVAAGGESAVGQRWAAALADRYPGAHQAKRIATALKVETRTAASWLAGQPPLAKHLCRAGLIHGPALVLDVLLPADPAAREARLAEELAAVERRLDGLRHQIHGLQRERDRHG